MTLFGDTDGRSNAYLPDFVYLVKERELLGMLDEGKTLRVPRSDTVYRKDGEGRIVRVRGDGFTVMPDMLGDFAKGRYVHDRPEYPLTFDKAMAVMSKGHVVECDLGSHLLFALSDGALMHVSHGEDRLAKATLDGRLLTAKWRVVL